MHVSVTLLPDSFAVWSSLCHPQSYCRLFAVQQLRAPAASQHDQPKCGHGGAGVYCHGGLLTFVKWFENFFCQHRVCQGAAVALLDKNGVMCAIGDVGPEYNKVPLAVTNVPGAADAASADQFGWILPFALTRNGECSRATAVRALRECVNFAVDESILRPHGFRFGVWGLGFEV